MVGKTPPPGFISLSDAQDAPFKSRASVIGAVVDYLPPMLTRTREHQLTVRLQDPKLRDAVYGHQGLKVRWFAKRLQDLPQINAIGDIMLLRDMTVSEWANEKMLLSHHRSAHLVFSATAVPLPAFKLEYASGNANLPCQGTDGQRGSLTPVVQEYIIEMKSELKIETKKVSNADTAPAAAQPANLSKPPVQPGRSGGHMPATAASPKLRLVKDLQHRVFSDICVQVVRKFTKDSGHCELYVTDYTANKEMFYYAPPEEKHDLVQDGDRYGIIGPPKKDWPGPYGYLVLKVNLIEPHSSFANREIERGDMVLIQNVKMKYMPPDNNRLEGDMWPDQHAPNKVQIRKMNFAFPKIQELCRRKDEYWLAREAVTNQTKKAEVEAEGKLSKAEKKRRAKQRKQEEARKQAEHEAALAEKSIQANPHVRCSYIDHPLTTISHILDPDNVRHTNTLPSGESYILPFINANHHIKARVIDFDPPRLEDFAIQLTQAELHDDKSEMSMDMTWDASPARWEWSFALHLEEVPQPGKGAEGQPPRNAWVNVGHLEAQHLFGNAIDDPTDLRENTTLLNQLREKLYILWGDLEERKRAEDDEQGDWGREAKRARLDDDAVEQTKEKRPSNLPFNCCLAEYGELRDGGHKDLIADWERQYMMFGVVIN